ncbi:BCCT family transporter [Tessaracoccus antarcticus]|uniref:BCCT family transporter n=1 Tax=Tessaracoccus antarcticus TaxID=2479848 RepID=UPI0018F68637|nr:BCCT family transporter [Tessaracoccus antarcticus]
MPTTPPETPLEETPEVRYAKKPKAGVFYPALGVILVFVVLAMAMPKKFAAFVETGNTAVVNGLGWYYVLLVTAFVFFSVWIAIGRRGDVVLGKDDETPAYSMRNWFAMLFAAGMGIGLVFWGVAEPLSHMATPPPDVAGGTQEAIAQAAMNRTFLHWGLHAWAIYVVVGLSIAYAVHRKGRPVSIRYALEPVLGDRVHGWLGNVVDVVAIVGTIFGVATSLGFGVAQVAGGLEFLGIAKDTTPLQVGLIFGVTALATLSVVSGLDKGIKWLSNLNMGLAALLLIVVLIVGPATLFILREFVQSIGSYLQNFFGLSFKTLPFHGAVGETWLGGWTTYYWGWWMSWSPFVGVFIARISRGRTVREFVAGVLLVPTLVTFLWFSVLGGTALWEQQFGGASLIDADGGVDQNIALFQMLEILPGTAVLSGVAIVLIVVFFVTSSDSGSFVIDMISHGGSSTPPVWSRVMWSLLEGTIAAVVLLAAGDALGLRALQVLAILVAAPWSIVMIIMCFSTAKALGAEAKRTMRLERATFRRELLEEMREDGGIT